MKELKINQLEIINGGSLSSWQQGYYSGQAVATGQPIVVGGTVFLPNGSERYLY